MCKLSNFWSHITKLYVCVFFLFIFYSNRERGRASERERDTKQLYRIKPVFLYWEWSFAIFAVSRFLVGFCTSPEYRPTQILWPFAQSIRISAWQQKRLHQQSNVCSHFYEIESPLFCTILHIYIHRTCMSIISWTKLFEIISTIVRK